MYVFALVLRKYSHISMLNELIMLAWFDVLYRRPFEHADYQSYCFVTVTLSPL